MRHILMITKAMGYVMHTDASTQSTWSEGGANSRIEHRAAEELRRVAVNSGFAPEQKHIVK